MVEACLCSWYKQCERAKMLRADGDNCHHALIHVRGPQCDPICGYVYYAVCMDIDPDKFDFEKGFNYVDVDDCL
jgi:hypothetical protein